MDPAAKISALEEERDSLKKQLIFPDTSEAERLAIRAQLTEISREITAWIGQLPIPSYSAQHRSDKKGAETGKDGPYRSVGAHPGYPWVTQEKGAALRRVPLRCEEEEDDKVFGGPWDHRCQLARGE